MERKQKSLVEKKPKYYDVVLMGFGNHKIRVIKIVRELTGLDLMEVKTLVEGAPKPVKEGVSKRKAAAMRKMLEDGGGTVMVARARKELTDN
jgi:large subunit ribosomal protein L7/L12